MFCPQCGQQQTSDIIRFCSRCGFPMDGVIHLLHNRGMLPVYETPQASGEISPRRRGVKQGGILLLSGALLVPLLGVLNSFASSTFFEILISVFAIICFMGGPLRMIFAALFEEGAPRRMPAPMTAFTPPPSGARPMTPGHSAGALPPRTATPTQSWRQRPTTAELMNPPSVTENTTRLLDKEEPRDG
jgi:hypothetical protein